MCKVCDAPRSERQLDSNYVKSVTTLFDHISKTLMQSAFLSKGIDFTACIVWLVVSVDVHILKSCYSLFCASFKHF